MLTDEYMEYWDILQNEGYIFFGEDEKWHIKDEAPQKYKKIFQKFKDLVLEPKPDENGLIKLY